jgi:hypothetical protein
MASSQAAPLSTSTAASPNESEKRQALWWLFVMAALLAAIAEVYLANPFLGPRRSIAPATTGGADNSGDAPEAGKENPYVSA